MNVKKENGQYEVLSPWAEVDPVPSKGITTRLTDLAGKKIGLFNNIKPASLPIMDVVEEKLKEKFPTCVTSRYAHLLPAHKGISDLEGEDKAKFEDWVKRVDVVVGAVAD